MIRRMFQRRGTAAEWIAANPVLGEGEIGIELHSGESPAVVPLWKVGDGVTEWTWLPYMGVLPDGNYGDIVVSNSGRTVTIANDVVTFAKLQNVAANSVLARAAGTAGDVSAVALAASQLLGRGSTGDVAAIVLGTGLTMTGTTLAASGSAGAMTYIGAATVSGAAATTLAISGLDLDADTLYFVQIEVGNATGSALILSLYYNADTTATNYDIQAFLASGTSPSPGRANSAAFMGVAANASASINGFITKNPTGTRVSSEWRARQDHTTAINLRTCAHLWRTTGTNVTGLTLSSNVANSLAIGTVIRVWKIDT
jgi:hypothetical protein